MFLAMSFLLSFISNAVLSDPGTVIPTKEEQANLLRNVEEVFTEVKLMVTDEGGATDAAVIGDVEKMVERAFKHLSLLENLILTKLSCSHSAQLAKIKPDIQNTIEEGKIHLEECVRETSNRIYKNSQNVTNTTKLAMDEGQVLLDTLHKCSSKSGLGQISCYKNIITADVFPLKLVLLDAIQMHKTGHHEAISIRNQANDCVDYGLKTYGARVAEILTNEAIVL